MERVLGIGGVFFRARDPKALAAWYEQHLGVTRDAWETDAGTTAFSPFPQTSKYFDRDEQQWMLNFRVRNLDAMAAQLRAAGIEVAVNPEAYDFGRFARLHDPEGNPIELWEPA